MCICIGNIFYCFLFSSCWKKPWSHRGCMNLWNNRKFIWNSRWGSGSFKQQKCVQKNQSVHVCITVCVCVWFASLSYHYTQRSLKSFRTHSPKATKSSQPSSRRWRRYLNPCSNHEISYFRFICSWGWTPLHWVHWVVKLVLQLLSSDWRKLQCLKERTLSFRWLRRLRSWRRRRPCTGPDGRAVIKPCWRWLRRCWI